jgi:hypothetical protein
MDINKNTRPSRAPVRFGNIGYVESRRARHLRFSGREHCRRKKKAGRVESNCTTVEMNNDMVYKATSKLKTATFLKFFTVVVIFFDLFQPSHFNQVLNHWMIRF